MPRVALVGDSASCESILISTAPPTVFVNAQQVGTVGDTLADLGIPTPSNSTVFVDSKLVLLEGDTVPPHTPPPGTHSSILQSESTVFIG